MKLLRNPVMVGVLAAAAVATVAWSILDAGGAKRRRYAGKHAAGASAAAAVPQTVPPPAAAFSLEELRPADLAVLRRRHGEWTDSPAHDPFGVRFTIAADASQTNVPIQGKLNGVWRQGSSYLAAIDQRVYQEGDTYGTYIVHRIEADRVVFRGPAGMDQIAFPTLPGEMPPGTSDDLASKKTSAARR